MLEMPIVWEDADIWGGHCLEDSFGLPNSLQKKRNRGSIQRLQQDISVSGDLLLKPKGSDSSGLLKNK